MVLHYNSVFAQILTPDTHVQEIISNTACWKFIFKNLWRWKWVLSYMYATISEGEEFYTGSTYFDSDWVYTEIN